MNAIKNGDVFSFSFNRRGPDDTHDYNWCFDGQLVAEANSAGQMYLTDTYWSDGNRRMTPEEALRGGDLQFRFNLKEVEEIRQHEVKYYSPSDVFNFSHHHGCYTRWMKRIGAQRNQEIMLTNIRAEIQEASRQVGYAQDHLRHLQEQESRINAGDTSVGF